MVGVGSVVTTEVRDVTREFGDLLEVEEVPGLAYLGLVTAGGVALAQEVVDQVMPLLNMNRDPQTITEFAVAGVIQMAFAFILGFAAVEFIGQGRPAIMATALGLAFGAVVIGGANLFEVIQRGLNRLQGAASSAQQAATQSGGSGNSNSPSESRRSQGSSTRTPRGAAG